MEGAPDTTERSPAEQSVDNLSIEEAKSQLEELGYDLVKYLSAKEQQEIDDSRINMEKITGIDMESRHASHYAEC